MEIDGKSSCSSSRTSPMFIRSPLTAEAAVRGDSVGMRGSVTLVAGEEDQAVLADLDLVAVGQLDGVDPVAVDVGAVEGADVGDREGVAVAMELGVLARDRDVVEEDLAVRVSTRADDVLVEEEPRAGARPSLDDQ